MTYIVNSHFTNLFTEYKSIFLIYKKKLAKKTQCD